MHARMHTCTHTHTHIHAQTHTHKHTHMHAHTNTHTCTHKHTHTHDSTNVRGNYVSSARFHFTQIYNAHPSFTLINHYFKGYLQSLTISCNGGSQFWPKKILSSCISRRFPYMCTVNSGYCCKYDGTPDEWPPWWVTTLMTDYPYDK